MKRLAFIIAACAVVAAPTAAALDPIQEKSLLRMAIKLSGLSAREPIWVVTDTPARFRQRRIALLDRSYPRAAQAYDERVYRALGLTAAGTGVLRRTLLALLDTPGLYDTDARTAFVPAGPGEAEAALREVVHGLQDQNFDLGRIRRLRGGADARIAARAAVEGYATLSTRRAPGRRRTSQRDPALRRFLRLRRDFVDSVGLRFEADLDSVGGSKATIESLRLFPATSEQVLHLDKYLQREPAAKVALPARAAGLRLAGESTVGELDVRSLLTVFGAPRVDRTASGWGGGRTARYTGGGREAVAVVLDWDTALDAAQWGAAVALYVEAAFSASTTSTCAVTTCWETGSRAIAFDRSGRRSALVLGADRGSAESLARALTTRF